MSRTVHFVGIGGSGLSAIAHVLHDQGDRVTGSDKAFSNYSENLARAGVQIFKGHSAGQVEGVDLVIASSAIPENNVELQAARAAGIPVLHRRQFLSDLTANYETIAVAGTHGKTTTSGMLAWILECAGMDPSFIVGGTLPDFGANGKAGGGKHFVVEADEYDNAFLGLSPRIGVVTNIEHDHPDLFPTYEDVREAFQAFADRISGILITCADDAGAQSLQTGQLVHQSYGFDPDANWSAEEVRANSAGGMDFLAIQDGKLHGLVRTRLPGMHNVLNTLAGLTVAGHLGIPFDTTREALTRYHGAGQRFEILGEQGGVTVIDDYAHHPTEIRATLATARIRYPDATIWAVFQPHTYSRIRALMAAYISAFSDADHVIVTEVFAAREELDTDMTGEKIAGEIEHPDVQFIGGFDGIHEHLLKHVKASDVVVILSAGNANQVGRMLLEVLTRK